MGIVRVSGPQVKTIANAVLPTVPQPRYALLTDFLNHDGSVIDNGIALYFSAPHSFTGEDVLELQGHGGPIVIDRLIKRILQLGARMAHPGEFSERAFLNDKLDLTQAEAIADLIDAQSEQAARSAVRSLQGAFSTCINVLLNDLIQLRTYVEAAIDFPDEEIDYLADGQVATQLQTLLTDIENVMHSAQQGAILRDGMTVVIAGKPNAGKSSLLNALSGRDSAIVTDIAGTTRDVLREQIHLDGMPLHIIDTAGLRESNDVVEQQGIKRAWHELQQADAVVLMLEHNKTNKNITTDYPELFALQKPIIVVHNKIDITNTQSSMIHTELYTELFLSVKTGDGLNNLTTALKKSVGYKTNTETNFTARRRHLQALQRAQQSVIGAQKQLIDYQAGELVAEELHHAQQALGEITGKFTSDDLLGKIFSSFCLGK